MGFIVGVHQDPSADDRVLDLGQLSLFAGIVAWVSCIDGGRRMAAESEPRGRSDELRAFLFITVVLAPLLAVAVVGGYGLLVWLMQIAAGPPGPPA